MLPGLRVTNYAGQTTLAQFIELAAGCEMFLTNDSGAMHIASALGGAHGGHVRRDRRYGDRSHRAAWPAWSASRWNAAPVF